jgi:4-amino-4-deoxy-L-arabinose transferase-like glycosyltransferase
MAPPKSSLAPLFAIALAGAFALLAATSSFGVGVSAESETYIAAARNFAAGRGLTVPSAAGELVPLTQHAPLYAWMLGVGARLGGDPVDVARWMAAVCFGGLALAAGVGIRILSKRTWLSPTVSALAVGSVVVLNVHLTALSESLFLLTTVGALLLLTRYFQTGEARQLAAAAILCALALLTRYAGIAAVATGVAAILRYDRPRRRWPAAGVFAVVSCAPFIVWSAYATLRTGNPVHREFAVHLVSFGDALAAMQAVSTWILPGVIPPLVRLPVLAAVLVWFGMVLRRAHCGRPCRVFLAFMGAYTLLIWAAKSFFDSAIPMDDRILSPLYVPALVAGALALDNAASIYGRRLAIAAPAVVLVLAVGGSNLVREGPCLVAMKRKGREYTGAAWHASQLAGWLQSVDPGVPVYSNVDSAIRFLRSGSGGGLPAKADVRSGRPNPAYPRELQRFRERLESARAVVVYFTDSPVRDTYLPSLGELIQQLGLSVVARGETWVALRPPSNQLPL